MAKNDGPKGYVIELGTIELRVYVGVNRDTGERICEDAVFGVVDILIQWLFSDSLGLTFETGLDKSLDLRNRLRDAKPKNITLDKDEHEHLSFCLKNVRGLDESRALYARKLMDLESIHLKA